MQGTTHRQHPALRFRGIRGIELEACGWPQSWELSPWATCAGNTMGANMRRPEAPRHGLQYHTIPAHAPHAEPPHTWNPVQCTFALQGVAMQAKTALLQGTHNRLPRQSMHPRQAMCWAPCPKPVTGEVTHCLTVPDPCQYQLVSLCLCSTYGDIQRWRCAASRKLGRPNTCTHGNRISRSVLWMVTNSVYSLTGPTHHSRDGHSDSK
jgi:hypothetical protein